MIECVEKLLKYNKTRDMSVFNLKSHISNKDFTVAVIKLLEWLRLDYKREQWILEGRPVKLKPLKLKKEYSWSQVLEQLFMVYKLF